MKDDNKIFYWLLAFIAAPIVGLYIGATNYNAEASAKPKPQIVSNADVIRQVIDHKLDSFDNPATYKALAALPTLETNRRGLLLKSRTPGSYAWIDPVKHRYYVGIEINGTFLDLTSGNWED